MRLLELELENWGRHESLKVDLSGGLQIGGRNGTGKSSILEAIRFIFSESGRGYAVKIRKGTDHARVKLRLSKDKDVYSIEKRLYPKKPSTAIMWVNRNPVADNSSTVYSKIQELIGEGLLDKLIYVPQGSMTEIIRRLGVKGGRQELDRLFGLDRLEKVYAGINDEIKVKEAQHSVLEQELAKYPKDASIGYDKEISEFEKEMQSSGKKLEGDRKEQNIIGQKIEQLEKKLNDMKAVKRTKEDFEKKINQLQFEEAALIKDIESAKNNISVLEDKKKEVGKLEKDIVVLRKYADFKELLSDLEDAESELKSIGNLEARKKSLDEAETELNKKYNLEMEYESMNKKIDDLNKKTAVLRERVSQKNSFLRELSSLSGKASCPKCGQELQPNHVAAEKKAAEEEIHKLEKDSKEYSFLLVTEQKKREPLEKQLTTLRNLDAERKQRKEDYEKAHKEREKLTVDCDKIKAELKKLGHAGETSKQVDEKARELQKIEGRIQALKGDIAGEKSYQQKITNAEMRLADLWIKKEDYEKQSGRLAYDEKLFTELENKRDEIKDQKNKAALEIEKVNYSLSEGVRKIKDLVLRKESFLEIEKKEKELAKETALMKEARDIFHTDKGMIKYLREKYIRKLSILLTQNFKRFNQNPRYRDILFDKDYELEIKTKEGSFSIEQLSGGELVQIALAMRMALLELLSPVRLMILDEPFGSLDKEHREALGEALNKIGGEGQLIIVTHIPVDSLQLPQLELGGY